jgi:membrane-bound ClpP family serine protease
MRKSLARRAIAATAILVCLIFAADAAAAERLRVLAVEFAGAVNPVSQGFILDQIERAGGEGYDAVVLLTDTPGGLDSSMREIIVPVVLYVHPPGSRAASAGVFLAMAADVAAMAPQTNRLLNPDCRLRRAEETRAKIVNDAAAYIRALADEHGRNGEWAESAVRQDSNLPARQLERGVIEFKDAANVISVNPIALQLRFLQTMLEISSERSSTLVLPLPLELFRPFLQGAAGDRGLPAGGHGRVPAASPTDRP